MPDVTLRQSMAMIQMLLGLALLALGHRRKNSGQMLRGAVVAVSALTLWR